jgi:betaine/carnitine transporter, BCCT family
MSPSDIKALRDKYQTDFKAGQDNYTLLGMDLHRSVFSVSAVLILVFVLGTLAFPEQAGSLLSTSKSWSINNFDWLFMIGCNIFLIFSLVLIFLPVGKLRLGGENARPDHSTWSWFSMLFAAGMGIGLMFWSVAEPVAYYTNWYGTPLNVEPKTPEGAALALGTTLFHWALHPWAIYCVVGLSLAFFSYNKGMPLTIRSAFYPLLGERVWGWQGDIIDILAVLATVFGLATSLGLGAQQATSGLDFLFGIGNNLTIQIIVIIAVTAVATLSVARGMEKGVKILSNLNMIMAFVLMTLVLVLGPTTDLFKWFATTVVSYASNIVPLSNWIGREDSDWYHGWTVFYWAWWVSWSPFVGMFIARISRGRTVREFVIAVLIVPTIVSAAWMSIFGGNAIEQVIAGTGELANGISNVSLAMFQMFEQMPLTLFTSFTAVVLVLLFFVTSADSGAMVVDSITAGGKLDSPVPQRMFWAAAEGFIAIALLVGGGKEALSALQAGSIATGLPFTIVLLLMCLSLYKGLDNELQLLRQRSR